MKHVVQLLLLSAVVAGCSQPAVQRHDWSNFSGPGAEVLKQETLSPPNFNDPIEPFNRSMWALNHAAVVAVVDPISRVYRFIMPSFLRNRIQDFADNLLFPRNFTANLLQGQWRGAGDETLRFTTNTTVGLLGFWDPASQWFHIQASPEDFGQVFSTWGWRSSTFLTLPLLGPSSVRDTVGLIPDTLLNPAVYILPHAARIGPTFDDMVDSIPDYRRFAASSPDAYDDARWLWGFTREERIKAPEISASSDNTGATQTLQAAFLGPRDGGFADRLDEREVTMPTTGRSLPFSFRMQPGRAPLVFLVPGLGGHRLSLSTLALAEMAWERGFSVAIVSNALNAEFIKRGGSVPVPGHAPVDARDIHIALDAVNRDLDTRFPARIDKRIFLGYSLGAFHGFFIAADDRPEAQQRVQFDRFLLLDPPVNLIDGMKRLDKYFTVPLASKDPEAEARRIILKAAAVIHRERDGKRGTAAYESSDLTDLESGNLMPTEELPFTDEEAKFLIGTAFRRSLQGVLWTSQEREDLGVLMTERRRQRRLPAYLEIGDYSFEKYLLAFVLPYHRDHLHTVSSVEDLAAKNDLRAIEGPLRGNGKLRVFANHNDFLTSDEDIGWLKGLIGSEHFRLFPAGGHLGNLNRPEVQAEVMNSLSDLVHAEGGNR